MSEISQKERMKLAKQGKALPDGSYPIRNTQDLRNAIQAFGRASNPIITKRFIKKRAKELDAEDLLPESWLAKAPSSSLFNTPDGSEFVSIDADKEFGCFSKARKGTPEYDKWLWQYREKRRAKSKPESSFSSAEEESAAASHIFSRNSELKSLSSALSASSKAFDTNLRDSDYEAWSKQVDKFTQNVADSLKDITGLSFNRSFGGLSQAQVGDYSPGEDASAIVQLSFDSGLDSPTDSPRSPKGLSLKIAQYPNLDKPQFSLNLSNASQSQLNKIVASLKEIDDFKSSQVSIGEDPQKAMRNHINKVLKKFDLL